MLNLYVWQKGERMMEAQNGNCKSVLIVEDDEAIRIALSEVLHDEGFEVFTATNGQDGLNVLDTIPRPCLILLDFMMPVMNGREFMEKKQQDDLIAAIPVVLISAFEDRSKAIGAAGFLKKPIEFDGLMRFLRHYCNEKNTSAIICGPSENAVTDKLQS